MDDDAVMGAAEALASDRMDLIDGLGVGLEGGGAAPESAPLADGAALGAAPRPDAVDAREDAEWRLSMSEAEDVGAVS